MYKLVIFVPESHLQQVKTAMFEAGAGKIGNYDQCCWQIQGTGQFRPLADSNPHTGTQGKLEIIDEWRIETVVDDKHIQAVITALKKAHPFETPAFDVIKMVDDYL